VASAREEDRVNDESIAPIVAIFELRFIAGRLTGFLLVW
jgi:hypothetical protein